MNNAITSAPKKSIRAAKPVLTRADYLASRSAVDAMIRTEKLDSTAFANCWFEMSGMPTLRTKEAITDQYCRVMGLDYLAECKADHAISAVFVRLEAKGHRPAARDPRDPS